MIKVPEGIVALTGTYDPVSYEVEWKNEELKPSGEIKSSHIKAICYASHMNHLTEIKISCFPVVDKSVLPGDIFLKWMELCQKNDLVIPSAKPEVKEGKNLLDLCGVGSNRHQVYATLCCYRWAENLAPMPYTIVKLMEERPYLDFYQALHYGMASYVTQPIHSFSTIQKYGTGFYSKKTTPKEYLPDGIGTGLFFRKKNGKSPSDDFPQPNQTFTAIQSITIKILPFAVECDDILREEWACLYRGEKSTPAEMSEYFRSVKIV